MAEPSSGDATLLTQIGVGVTTILGWFWAMITGNRRKLDEIKADLAEHEKHVAENYPTRAQMEDTLDKTVRPIHDKLDKIADKLDRERDEELNRLRKLAGDRRGD
jgi:uncharacterized membrane-anchored protein YhcB (DUF1043 family)